MEETGYTVRNKNSRDAEREKSAKLTDCWVDRVKGRVSDIRKVREASETKARRGLGRSPRTGTREESMRVGEQTGEGRH